MDVKIVEILNFAMPESSLSLMGAHLDGAHGPWVSHQPCCVHCSWWLTHWKLSSDDLCHGHHCDLAPRELVSQGSGMNPTHVMTGGLSVELGVHDP